ncbi:hypothetical protein GW17_00055341 [Ensete ventricosum]|nr:hypothetical protein GW17_00055341 [Ensete ventricosum]
MVKGTVFRASYALAGPYDFTQTWVDGAPKCGRLMFGGHSAMDMKQRSSSKLGKKKGIEEEEEGKRGEKGEEKGGLRPSASARGGCKRRRRKGKEREEGEERKEAAACFATPLFPAVKTEEVLCDGEEKGRRGEEKEEKGGKKKRKREEEKRKGRRGLQLWQLRLGKKKGGEKKSK